MKRRRRYGHHAISLSLGFGLVAMVACTPSDERSDEAACEALERFADPALRGLDVDPAEVVDAAERLVRRVPEEYEQDAERFAELMRSAARVFEGDEQARQEGQEMEASAEVQASLARIRTYAEKVCGLEDL